LSYVLCLGCLCLCFVCENSFSITYYHVFQFPEFNNPLIVVMFFIPINLIVSFGFYNLLVIAMGVANNVVGIIVVFLILGTIGATAVVMASNATLYTGAPAVIVTLFTVGVVALGAIAIVLYMIPSKAVALSPVLIAVRWIDSVRGWISRLLHKLKRC
jgi:hypothetical protein